MLASRGVTLNLGEAARAVYGDLEDKALEKMMTELAEIGACWPDSSSEEVVHALQIPFTARR